MDGVAVLQDLENCARRLMRVIALHDGFMQVRIERRSLRGDFLHAETGEGGCQKTVRRLNSLQQQISRRALRVRFGRGDSPLQVVGDG